MERGKLTFEHVYPNGIQEVSALLVQPVIKRLQAPLDKVRLESIGLEKDTENEEQFIAMREALCHLLSILAHR